MSMILSSSLFDNERIQTSKIVVIVWQWINSNIENRRHCLFYFKFLNMFLFNHFLNQTRKFAHYQYYYIHWQSRLMHNRKQKRNHFEKLISRCQKSIEFFISLLIWNSFEHELFVFRSLIWSSFEHELFVSRLIWFQHFCLITSKWFDFCIFVWSYRNDLIWKIIIIVILTFDKFKLIKLFAKIVANTKTIVFEVFFQRFSKSFEQIVRIAEFLLMKRNDWDFDDIIIKVFCELVVLQKSFWRKNLLFLFWASIFTRTIWSNRTFAK